MNDEEIAERKATGGALENTVPRDNASLQVPYSIFSKSQRRGVTLIIGTAMMFSPLSANIYLPCVPLLQADMNTSLQKINLTITAYVIVQGIAPAFFGELADKLGRRPIYIVTFVIYLFASIGLAVQQSYAALLLLRMLQSFGASATVAIGYGVVADMVTVADRGSMLGPAMVATNLGPVVGPLIGGPLSYRAGWRWVFWLLAILGGIFLIVILFCLPESCRAIVGNGSIPAKHWNRHWVSYLFPVSEDYLQNDDQTPNGVEKTGPGFLSRLKAVLPNPWKSLCLLIEKDTSFVLFISAIFYAVYYIVQASIPALLFHIYLFNASKIGICYLAIGFGVIIGGYINGRLLDLNYRVTANKIGLTLNNATRNDLKDFPIERARGRFSIIYVSLHTICVVAYGWTLHLKTHIAGPLILQFCIGLLATFIVQTYNTLLVDIHEDIPSTAAASGNIARCALSAGGVAIMQPLLDRLGSGIFFSGLGVVSGMLGVGSILVVGRSGMRWRVERIEKKAQGGAKRGEDIPSQRLQESEGHIQNNRGI